MEHSTLNINNGLHDLIEFIYEKYLILIGNNDLFNDYFKEKQMEALQLKLNNNQNKKNNKKKNNKNKIK